MKKPTKNKIATVPVLLLNLLMPGLGTVLSGNKSEGFWQLGLFYFSVITFIIGILFTLTIIGIIIGVPLIIIAPGIYIVALVWSITSSFN